MKSAHADLASFHGLCMVHANVFNFLLLCKTAHFYSMLVPPTVLCRASVMYVRSGFKTFSDPVAGGCVQPALVHFSTHSIILQI